MLGILFPSLNRDKIWKISLGILMQVLTNSQWEFKCNLLCVLNLCIDIGTRYISNMKRPEKTIKRPEMSRNSISVYCLNIFGSIFGVLFYLLIRKSILGNKTISNSVRKFPCVVWSVRTFPHMTKKKLFLFVSWKLHIGMAWISLDNYLSIRPAKLETILKI